MSTAPRWLTIKCVHTAALFAQAHVLRRGWCVWPQFAQCINQRSGEWWVWRPRDSKGASKGRTVQDACKSGQLGTLPHSVNISPGPGWGMRWWRKFRVPEWGPLARCNRSSSHLKNWSPPWKSRKCLEFLGEKDYVVQSLEISF